ncbi:hypothetical protein RA210_U10601 [Rubrivivax sp. A210]|uniref:hypothetical protein n=1 Tax=Rubrivivax sp. A210 TaxID=2772301 RepID=UPI001918125E|nr:hypothetical protein [Rubrivivax sp. A210]CAD5366989.1 hypothetical protein RA210_U10601 [Rubrivivax sp. A210]
MLGQMLEEAMECVGLVGTRILVRGNPVVDATVLSGPKEYAKYVLPAIRCMKCSAGGAEEGQEA